MQTRSNFLSRRLACNFILSLALLCLGIAPARAGLNFELHLYRSGDFYFFYTPLTTNGVAPDAALGSYVVFSPQWITGAQGAWRQFEMTSSNLNFVNGGSSGFSDLSSALGQITNGSWSILFTNATTTNLYQFTVSAPDLTSDMLPETDITFPISGSLNITNRPAFTWEGPGWSVGPMVEAYNEDASFFQYQNLPASASSWNIPAPLPYYSNVTFYISYQTNTSPSVFSAGAPLSTNLALPISGWTSSSVLESTANSFFTVGGPGIGASGHTNVAYWSFEDNSLFAQDFSGNGNNLSYAWFGTPPYISSDAEAGSYAGGFGGSGWFTAPSNLLSTLAGSFTVSAWVKTTDNTGNDDDSQYSAKGILSALDNNYSQAVMPMGLTGGKL
ncbi:MAG TPA: hypothetical protein VHH88_14340, partial [Verrucomicrobiae bacterium]|nr:hypothetical protein [Verrucomicrobiae bacterium]